MLDVGLLAAADLLDAPVPAHVLRRIKRDSTAEKLVEQAKWLLFEEPEMTMRFHALKQIAMKERVVDKLKSSCGSRWCRCQTITTRCVCRRSLSGSITRYIHYEPP